MISLQASQSKSASLAGCGKQYSSFRLSSFLTTCRSDPQEIFKQFTQNKKNLVSYRDIPTINAYWKHELALSGETLSNNIKQSIEVGGQESVQNLVAVPKTLFNLNTSLRPGIYIQIFPNTVAKLSAVPRLTVPGGHLAASLESKLKFRLKEPVQFFD